MKYILVWFLLLLPDIAHSERAPALPPTVKISSVGSCAVDGPAGLPVLCVMYEDTIGGEKYIWLEVQLVANGAVIRITWWKEHEPRDIIWQVDSFYYGKRTSL